MDLVNKNVLVVGTGISGIAAVKLLCTEGAKVYLQDSNEALTEQAVLDKLPKSISVQVIIGELPKELKDNIELVVLSPGVPLDLPYIQEMKKNNVPIWGEIELAYQFSKGKMAAITGTNGKTTTTALVGEIMRHYYVSVYVVGNIGIPYTDMVLNTKGSSITVAEMSSFQLETVHEFRPEVSAILNITPDHLNRHHTMENYIAAKKRIAINQGINDTCVLNYEDEVLREMAKTLRPKVFFFSSKRELEEGIFLDKEGNFVYKENGINEIVCNIKDLKLLGTHNYENVMAAIAISYHIGVPMEAIREAVTSFTSVEHRIEYVTEKNGVTYYNDSKGTNPDAAIKGIQAMVKPTFLIGGGYDKGSDYKEWIQSFDGKVKKLVLIGATKEKIKQQANECGFTAIEFADSLEEAVKICAVNASEGDAVLLSPACASWGMFKNFEERGRKFKEYVNQL
ncbi:UDP-N-acetylmuramoyl-L-alanine--D-glutamate ligase [Velocimicrobium porci]|uniref:UDP-N-acetylmuramoylalanine--D-glutamate ligase n=1 Tax=Velocimicrobium porci TaxID=2606634 RepID=A0A6L5XWQ6_9FIRM|nr:UDP-N-acetylmuramoyl-L-alanine--D-glutamate ligase [Velocimicrobium porci]MSS63034.1 UDP-N-acetylmuramoyl-L-alanine--D-glutamate ligase [Velocimicrobium porci]